MPIVTVTKNSCEINALYQWDLNQELIISGLSLPTAPEVHFAQDSMKLAIVRQATMDPAGVVRVVVPNALLQKPNRINAYVCTNEGGSFQTLYKIVIPVIGRAQPSDYEATSEAEVYSLEALSVEVITLEPGTDATVEKVLTGEDTWTLRFSIPRGKDGHTPVKGVDYTDGYTPVKGVDYTDGKDGKDGTNGKDGADGYTPVRGTDYWTADDRSAIVADVLAALPVAEGGSF